MEDSILNALDVKPIQTPDLVIEWIPRIDWNVSSIEPPSIKLLRQWTPRINWDAAGSTPMSELIHLLDAYGVLPPCAPYNRMLRELRIKTYHPPIAVIERELIEALFHPMRYAKYLAKYGFED